MPVPDRVAPTESAPDVTLVTVRTVPEIDPVTVAVCGSKFSVVLVVFALMPSSPEYDGAI